ncbi:unannotated protein [freshwater metagenome]|uniref:Unannotated protein n=1 Tax=freshwater metagenome TaxID=449393 RepID=A0A6J6LHZ7_9ZZZZ
MPLPHCHCREPIVAKHFRNESSVFVDAAVKARETCGVIGDTAHSCRVLVTTGQQACTRRRAHCRGVETAVSQTLFGEAVEVRCFDIGTETTDLRVANIVENDKDNVRRSLRRKHNIGIGLNRIFKGSAYSAGKWFAFVIGQHQFLT